MEAIEEEKPRRSRSLVGSTSRQRITLATAAVVPALLYLLYVFHYSVNVPIADDWNTMPLISAAFHHDVTLNELWVQYGDTRLFLSFLFFVGFALSDHLNEKTIILCSAALYITTFVLILGLFRSYIERPLTFLRVFSLGIVWFSLADVQNSLWSFQLAWYFVVLAFAATAFVLLVPHNHRNWFFGAAIVAAVAASLAEVQGFVVWPVGLICVLWAGRRGHRAYFEGAIWIGSAALTTVIYLRGFVFAADTYICVVEGGQRSKCSLTFGLLHPLELGRFFLILVGNVIPTNPGRYLLAHELVGSALCIAAAFVVVQTIRERRVRTNPLPLVLIAFALMFDAILALSRLGEGVSGAGLNRYTMPNIVLLAGILVYAWKGLLNVEKPEKEMSWLQQIKPLARVMLVAFLILQCVVATRFGIRGGDSMKATSLNVARVVVNLDRIPSDRRACYFESVVVGPPISALNTALTIATQEHLSVFQDGAGEQFRLEGPPHVAHCDRQ